MARGEPGRQGAGRKRLFTPRRAIASGRVAACAAAAGARERWSGVRAGEVEALAHRARLNLDDPAHPRGPRGWARRVGSPAGRRGGGAARTGRVLIRIWAATSRAGARVNGRRRCTVSDVGVVPYGVAEGRHRARVVTGRKPLPREFPAPAGRWRCRKLAVAAFLAPASCSSGHPVPVSHRPARGPPPQETRHEQPRFRHRQPDPHPAAVAHRRRHAGGQPDRRGQLPPLGRGRVGRRAHHLLGASCASAPRPSTSSPR